MRSATPIDLRPRRVGLVSLAQARCCSSNVAITLATPRLLRANSWMILPKSIRGNIIRIGPKFKDCFLFYIESTTLDDVPASHRSLSRARKTCTQMRDCQGTAAGNTQFDGPDTRTNSRTDPTYPTPGVGHTFQKDRALDHSGSLSDITPTRNRQRVTSAAPYDFAGEHSQSSQRTSNIRQRRRTSP